MSRRMQKQPSGGGGEAIAVEREGKVTRWTLYDRPVTGTRSEKNAYARGFRQYITDWNMGVVDQPTTVDFRKKSDRDAYELGYNDAKTGGVDDGRENAEAAAGGAQDNRAFVGGSRGGKRAAQRTAAAQARRNVLGDAATRSRKRAKR
jgi:hypothetical protein